MATVDIGALADRSAYPYAEQGAEAMRDRDSTSVPHASTKKPDVLIVDDDPSVTEVLELLLGREFDVRTVHGVADALLATGLHEPDVIVTDLQMDDGGGEHLLAVVARQYPHVLRVVHSASADTTWLLDAGLADAIVEKTVDVAVIAGAISSLLSTREPPSSGERA